MPLREQPLDHAAIVAESGVFTLALAFLLLSATVGAAEPRRRGARAAVTAALAALIVDVYLY